MSRELKLSRPLAVFDIESTGVVPQRDRIVELAVLKIYPDGRRQSTVRRLNPQMPIPAGATAIHGISDADVADAPTFSDIADLISQCAFSDCRHGNEPGCAVRKALEDGTLTPERWKMYTRLERENRWNKITKNEQMMNNAMLRRKMRQERKGRG